MLFPAVRAALAMPCLVLLAATGVRGDTVREVRLAEGTEWETPAVVRRAERPGPTVVVVGGMHGDEPAGRRAVRGIRHWEIVRGTLVVVPEANARGCAEGRRTVPAKPAFDLNRRFPSEDRPVTGPLAGPLWRLVAHHEPDWLIDLHESVNYRSKTTEARKHLGNTLIADAAGGTKRVAGLLARAANALTSRKDRRWVVLTHPIGGSLARAAADRLGAHAVISETTKKDHLAIRVRQHRIVVHRLLRELGMLPEGSSPYAVFPEERDPDEVRIALFDTSGCGSRSAWRVERRLPEAEGFRPRRITATEIRARALRSFDVVVFPGGNAAGQSRALGNRGLAAVREFVGEGGGYLGFCAGAYLATRQYTWSLALVDSKVLDTKHWARGTGIVRLRLTATGRSLFEAKREPLVYYAQGPLLAPAEDPGIPDFEPLAHYATEVAKNGAPKGVMPGSAAVVRGRYGRGRVLLFSPHPERTKGLGGWVPRAARWVAGD